MENNVFSPFRIRADNCGLDPTSHVEASLTNVFLKVFTVSCTPSRRSPKDRRADAIVSEYTKNPCAAGCSMNFLISTPSVTTLVMKLIDPRII